MIASIAMIRDSRRKGKDKMTKKYSYLAGRLRQLELTQDDVARKLGIQQPAVSRRFNGRTPWTSDEMYQILDICRAKPEELHLYFPRDGRAAS